jgi:uncharacterized protein YaaW (UPF0174 family)
METFRDVLLKLDLADYVFLSKTITTWHSAMPAKIKANIAQFELNPSHENRAAVVDLLEYQIGYLGSSDIAFFVRFMGSSNPAVSFQKIVSDAAKRLKVKLTMGPLDEQLEQIVTSVASKRLASMKPEQLEELLMKAGANKEDAKDFLKKHGGTLSLSVLALIIRIFGKDIAEEIVSAVTVNIITRYLGKTLAKQVVTQTAERFPWWSEWFGPVVWVATGAWLAVDLQGPAYRKTVPAVLYLGLCVTRIKRGNGN